MYEELDNLMVTISSDLAFSVNIQEKVNRVWFNRNTMSIVKLAAMIGYFQGVVAEMYGLLESDVEETALFHRIEDA